jgi:hypothetical protein
VFVTGSDDPTRKGGSIAAWEIRESEHSVPVMRDVAVSDGPKSDMYRATIAAVVGAVESIAPGSSAKIHCRNKGIVDGINDGFERWRLRGWENASGRLPKALKIIKRYARVIAERKLTVVAEFCRKGASEFDGIFERLLVITREAAAPCELYLDPDTDSNPSDSDF